MEIVSEKNIPSVLFEGYEMINIFNNLKKDDQEIKIGKAIIKSGTRVPDIGFGVHDSEEYSYIIKGRLDVITKEGNSVVTAGDYTYIQTGEEHASINNSNEDCELIWFLIKRE